MGFDRHNLSNTLMEPYVISAKDKRNDSYWQMGTGFTGF